MALRVMAYEALLYQDLLRTKRLPRREPLPPTVAIVLYKAPNSPDVIFYTF